MFTTIILTAASSMAFAFLGYQICELVSAIAARRAQLRKRK